MPPHEKDCQCASITALRAWRKFKREVKRVPLCMRVSCGILASMGINACFCFVYAMWLKSNFTLINAESKSHQTSWELAGPFGDSFGALNAFFAGMNVLVAAVAFFGFLYALQLQREDLRLQRKEMKESREEMERQTNELKAQTLIQNVSRLQAEKNYIQEQVCKAHKEELEEAYRLIDITHKRIRDFILTSDMRYMCGEPIIAETISAQEAKRTEGVYAFQYLWGKMLSYISYLSSDERIQGELEKYTRDIYACCDIASGISYIFSRAVQYALFRAEHLLPTERSELILYLFSSHVNEVGGVIICMLEGDRHYPSSHEWLVRFSASHIFDNKFPTVPIPVKTAFMYVLRSRTLQPRNIEKIAAGVEAILDGKTTNEPTEPGSAIENQTSTQTE